MTDLNGYREPGVVPAIKRANGVKRWNRRVGTALIWTILNFSCLILEPVLKLDAVTVQLFMEKSTWIAGLLIVGLTSTDTVIEYVKGKKQ